MKLQFFLVFALVFGVHGEDYEDRRWFLQGLANVGKKLVDIPVKAVETNANLARGVLDIQVHANQYGSHALKEMLKVPVSVVQLGGKVAKGILDISVNELAEQGLLAEIRSKPFRSMFFAHQKIKKIAVLAEGTLIILANMHDEDDSLENYREDIDDLSYEDHVHYG